MPVKLTYAITLIPPPATISTTRREPRFFNTRITDIWDIAISNKTIQNDFQKYVIVEYFYIYWFIIILQKELHIEKS